MLPLLFKVVLLGSKNCVEPTNQPTQKTPKDLGGLWCSCPCLILPKLLCRGGLTFGNSTDGCAATLRGRPFCWMGRRTNFWEGFVRCGFFWIPPFKRAETLGRCFVGVSQLNHERYCSWKTKSVSFFPGFFGKLLMDPILHLRSRGGQSEGENVSTWDQSRFEVGLEHVDQIEDLHKSNGTFRNGTFLKWTHISPGNGGY